MRTASRQSTLDTNFSTFGSQQQNSSTHCVSRYLTTGLLTCLTVSITEYDDPSVDNRSGAEKVIYHRVS